MAPVPSLDELISDLPEGSPVERLTAASLLAQRLHARGDELLDQLVDAARAQGASWTEIGRALQTSKQAAQQRFAVVAQAPMSDPAFGLTGAAADAFAAAGGEARQLGHHYVRPEHLILGMLSLPEEMAARALTDQGVSLDRAREQVIERFEDRGAASARFTRRRAADQAAARARRAPSDGRCAISAPGPSTCCSPPSRRSWTAPPRGCWPSAGATRRRFAST